MRIFTFTILGILLYSTVCAQSPDDMTALREAVGAEKFDYMASHDPERLGQMALANRHGYYISPVGDKGVSMDLPDALMVNSNYQNAPAISLELLESGNMDRLLYDFDVPQDGIKVYRIGAVTDRVLIIMSSKVVNLHKSYYQE